MDKLTPQARSRNMRLIRSRDTSPELSVRRYLHGLGFRFRLHDPKLPGKPDLVFPSRRAAVFVHGCFWHGCQRCADGLRKVKSNASYWSPKIEGNKERDQRHMLALQNAGWHVFTIWECEVEPNRLEALAAELQQLSRN
jgi:DNA mismatch endonuclease (patch repair protein)